MPIEVDFADARWKRVPKLQMKIIEAHAAALSKRDAAKLTALLLSNDKEIKNFHSFAKISASISSISLPLGGRIGWGGLLLRIIPVNPFNTCHRS